MHRFKNLEIWKRSVQLATSVYLVTSKFPECEKFGLTAQIRRSVVSLGSNIAEGAGRITNKDFKHFLSIAYGSSCELETQLIISKNLKLISEAEVDVLFNEIDELQKMIYSFSKSLV